MNYLSDLKGRVLQDKDAKEWQVQGCQEFEPTDTPNLQGVLNFKNIETGEEREIRLQVPSDTPQERMRYIRSVIESNFPSIIDAVPPVEISLTERGGGIYIKPVLLN